MTDETKLPKWAQNSLFVLRAKVAQLEDACATLQGEAVAAGATGKVLVDDYPLRIPLHDRASVRFVLPHGYITCSLRDGGNALDLNCSETMHILPRATNAAWVVTDSR